MRILAQVQLAVLLCVIMTNLSIVGATTITVSTLVDETDGVTMGQISLRDAFTAAAATTESASIDFSVTGTLLITSPLPAIETTVTVVGPGAGALSVSAMGTTRMLFIDGGELILEGLTLDGGRARGGDGGKTWQWAGGGGGGAGMGGAVLLSSGSLTATNVAFTSHTAEGGAGAPYGASTGAAPGGGGGGIGADAVGSLGGSGAPFLPTRHGTDGIGGNGTIGFWDGSGQAGGFAAGGAGGALSAMSNASAGGPGGYGGGGGGGSANNGSGGGSVGFGGSGGGANLAWGSPGGGGAALGAAIFVREGASLHLTNCSFTNCAASGGSVTTVPGSSPATAGSGKGAAIFVMPGAHAWASGLQFFANNASSATGSGYLPNALSDTVDVYGTILGPSGIHDWECHQ